MAGGTSFLEQIVVEQTPTVSTSPAYTAKDAVGGLLTFSNAARYPGGSGIIQSAALIDLSQQMPSLELCLFDRAIAAPTDNAVFDPTDAELKTLLCVIALSSYGDFNDNSASTRGALGIAFKLFGGSGSVSATANLYGALVTRGTPTLVGTADITVRLAIIQD